MGIFKAVFESLFGSKKQTSTQPSDPNKSSTPVIDHNPRNKKADWFPSKEGIESLKEHTTPKAYLLEERLNQEYKNKDFGGRDVSFDIFLNVYHKDAVIPQVYFSNFVNTIEVQPLKYVGPSAMLTGVLSTLAKTYYLDDDGEPVEKKSALTPEDLVSFENNPVLKFVKAFTCFQIEDDDEGSWTDKFALYSDVLIFLGLCSFGDKNVLNENAWLLDKATYFNNLGTVKKEKGFIKYCIEKCTYPDYWKSKLGKLEEE